MADSIFLQLEREAGTDARHPAQPTWDRDVPLCDEACYHHDGKRCGLMGFRPDRMCEPVVVQMTLKLRNLTGGSNG